MNWKHLRNCAWLDSRAAFVNRVPRGGKFLEVGCSRFQNILHFQELRPDLDYSAVDLQDVAAFTPNGCHFHRMDIIQEKMPFGDNTFDAVSVMQVFEHLPEFGKAPSEIARILKPGGRLYIEGPAPRSLLFPSSKNAVTNFYDDPTHIAPLSKGRMRHIFSPWGLKPVAMGQARSWMLILALPVSLIRGDWVHFASGWLHLFGWSARVVLEKQS